MKSPAWQTKAGQNAKGGLNAKGRASYNKETGGNAMKRWHFDNCKGKT